MAKLTRKQPSQQTACAICQQRGHSSYECSKRKSNTRSSNRYDSASNVDGKPKQGVMAMQFEHEDYSVPLESAPNFRGLLADIRQHLCTSQSTRAVYVEIAHQFYRSLPVEVRRLCGKPTDSDFKKFIESQWPTFKTVMRNHNRLLWGYVLEGDGAPHTIHILSDIVVSAELAAKGSATTMGIHEYNLILMVIVLHEIVHVFTKTWFCEIVTPVGVGIGSDPETGEGGDLGENLIMGGIIRAEWNGGRAMVMDHIDCLMLECGSDTFVINADMAKDVLDSLQSDTFRPPPKDLKCQSPLPKSIRARITQATDIPPCHPTKLKGLGISYLGDDKYYR